MGIPVTFPYTGKKVGVGAANMLKQFFYSSMQGIAKKTRFSLIVSTPKSFALTQRQVDITLKPSTRSLYSCISPAFPHRGGSHG